MPLNIQLDMRLSSLIETFPETRSVFTAHGLGKLVSDDALQVVGPFLTLKTALLSHGIATDEFLEMLNACYPENAPLDAPCLPEAIKRGPATLLALMPCGLKVPIARALAAFIDRLNCQTNKAFNYAVESNLNHEMSYYPYVAHIETPDALPDIILSSDFNAFYYHRFYKRFVRTGHFVSVLDYTPNTHFVAAGIADPLRQYTILGVNPLIIVADLEKTGDRPLPRTWADLLDPMWHRSITLRGNEHFFCHAVLLPLNKEHGLSAMTALAHNVLDGRHPSQMVKTAGSGRSAALYVMPAFFARKIPEGRAVQMIWPTDGALASPVTLLVKAQRAATLKPITDYLIGQEIAQIFGGACFPSPHPDVDSVLPDKATLKWLGWDYIRANDLEQINAEIDQVFLPAIRKGGVA